VPGIYGSVQQLDGNSANGALFFVTFLVIFQIFRETVALVGLVDEELMTYMTEVYATMSLSSADPAISTILLSKKMLSCVIQMLANKT